MPGKLSPISYLSYLNIGVAFQQLESVDTDVISYLFQQGPITWRRAGEEMTSGLCGLDW